MSGPEQEALVLQKNLDHNQSQVVLPDSFTGETTRVFLSKKDRESSPLRILNSWKTMVDQIDKPTEGKRPSMYVAASRLIVDVFSGLSQEETYSLFSAWEQYTRPIIEAAKEDSSEPRLSSNQSRLGTALYALDLQELKEKNSTFAKLASQLNYKIISKKAYAKTLVPVSIQLLVLAEAEYKPEYRGLVSRLENLSYALPYVERYAERAIAADVFRDLQRRTYDYRTLEPRVLPLLRLLLQGNTAKQILHQFGLEDSPAERDRMHRFMQHFSFGYFDMPHSTILSLYFHEHGQEEIFRQVDKFIRKFEQYIKDNSSLHSTTINKVNEFSSIWKSLLNSQQRRIITLGFQTKGVNKIISEYDIRIDLVQTFMNNFVRFLLDGEDLDRLFGKQNKRRQVQAGFQSEREAYRIFQNTLFYLSREPFIAVLLPSRVQQIINYMTAYIQEYNRNESKGNNNVVFHDKTLKAIAHAVAKKFEYEESYVKFLHRQSAFFTDIVTRLMEVPQRKRVSNSTIKGLRALNFVDYAKAKKGQRE